MSLPVLPAGAGFPLVDQTSGEFLSDAVKDWLDDLYADGAPDVATAINAESYGAVGNDTGDYTDELQAFLDAFLAVGGDGYIPPGTYRISAPLVMGSNVSGDWTLRARGVTLKQMTSNVPILHFTKEGSRGFTIDGLQFTYNAQQAYTNTMASCILFDPSTNLGFGWYNFQFLNMRFSNAARGISIDETNSNMSPIWGFRFENIDYESNMTGPAIKLVQTSSGQPNATIRNLYVRGDSFDPAAGEMVKLSGFHGLTMDAIEFNDVDGKEMLIENCESINIGQIRSERGTFASAYDGLWTISNCRGSVGPSEVQSKTIDVGGGAWGFIWRLLGNDSDLFFHGGSTLADTTVTSGAVAFYDANSVGYWELAGGVRRTGSSIPYDPIFLYDEGPKRMTRNRNYFPQGVKLVEFNGAGKTTVADADFSPITPADGTVALVRNTSDNTVRLACRANGTWRYIAFA